ncbi:MAG: twin-arginine translocase subunit TatC [Paludibacteraceae bacterium]|nr:twin-arginine translocase subunit TatC [Paludibacteraceae bacterium]
MSENNEMLTFGGHLEVLRKMLFRVLVVSGVIAVVVFFFKDVVFSVLLAPGEYDFCTYRWIERLIKFCGYDFTFEEYHVDLIATDLSSQFMTHITTSCILGLLGASPYVLYELFRFVSPALYENERKYSVSIVVSVYLLFMAGVLMSYFVLFPISFRFLGTYSVSKQIRSTITLDSYITTFSTLTFVMGVVFQLPVIAFALAKMEIVTAKMLATYRRHAFLIICIVAAIITPPDIMTLIVVAIPLYLLYEFSIRIVKLVEK